MKEIIIIAHLISLLLLLLLQLMTMSLLWLLGLSLRSTLHLAAAAMKHVAHCMPRTRCYCSLTGGSSVTRAAVPSPWAALPLPPSHSLSLRRVPRKASLTSAQSWHVDTCHWAPCQRSLSSTPHHALHPHPYHHCSLASSSSSSSDSVYSSRVSAASTHADLSLYFECKFLNRRECFNPLFTPWTKNNCATFIFLLFLASVHRF